MRLLIIRHGDPDYSIDSLTEKGWKEAELLKKRLLKLDISAFYVSPLGRAQATAKPTLEALNKTARVCDWLREFDGVVKEKYKAVCDGLDGLLARHGYVHNGKIFNVEKENTDTVALFCHFGVECVLLSHLLKISPMALWQGFVALPSSVTTLNTEEREQGVAYFRCSGFGDISHLYAGDEPASFQARFCETYSNFEERH